MRCSIGKLRAMRLLNKSQQVRSQFVISLLFIYQGELKVLRKLGESTEQRVFWGFEV
ncbi:MAG: hypothetical protein JGK28_12645 [Microcoleus sp. PH2017_07_MST_O_A]|nr:hypothetical protein [Microcoleus sp. PH2017_07_MST_O_A]